MRQIQERADGQRVPYPFSTAQQMLDMAARSGLTYRPDEARQRGIADVARGAGCGLDRIWDAMRGCIDRGLKVDGIMPGGLNVRRRARSIHESCRKSGAATASIRCSPTIG